MFWRRRRQAGDFREEISSHLQLEADENRSGGMAEGEARSSARKAFGNVTAAEERFYEKGRAAWLDHLLQDVRYGLRAMWKSPGFTAALVVTLALGMGANTAIFTLIDAVLLRPLPVSDPSSLYFLSNAGARDVGGSPPYPCFERFRSLAKSFAGIAAYAPNDHTIRLEGTIDQVDSASVSGNYYEVLGVAPFAGRLLNGADDALTPPAAVISYEYWQHRFGGAPEAIGKTFTLDDRIWTIVGITPPEFNGLTPGRHDDLTLPITLAGPKVLQSTSTWFFQAVGRLRAGVAPEQARAEIDPIFQAFMNEFPVAADARRDYFHHMELTPAGRGSAYLRKRFSRPLVALMTVVALVLLIGCANITNLLLARAVKREKEFAVRMAMGAGRGRLFRQVLVETGLLFGAGALAGLLFARWAASALAAFFSTGLQPILLDLHGDWRITGFTAGLSLLATLIFGAAPVVRAMRSDPHRAMKEGGRTTAGRGSIDLGRVLIAFQVALSMILLIAAGLFLRTLDNLYRMSAGFHAGQVALVVVHPTDPRYNDPTARVALWDRLLATVAATPGVSSVSLSRSTPLDGGNRVIRFEVPGIGPQSQSDGQRMMLPSGAEGIRMNIVSEGYFSTFGVPVLKGRGFTAADRADPAASLVINESARRHFFVGRDPVGMTVRLGGNSEYQVIGVVEDGRQSDLRKEPVPSAFIPLRQTIDQAAFMTLGVRTPGDPQRMIADVERLARGLSSGIQIVRSGTLERQIDDSLLQERLISTLAAAFGALALLLSSVGLYGVLTFSVGRRTSEIGIRIALGALPREVAWSILRQTLGIVAIGLGVGLGASILLARLVEKLLYGVTPTDAVAQIGSAALLLAVACTASYFPARRAGGTDPVAALRSE